MSWQAKCLCWGVPLSLVSVSVALACWLVPKLSQPDPKDRDFFAVWRETIVANAYHDISQNVDLEIRLRKFDKDISRKFDDVDLTNTSATLRDEATARRNLAETIFRDKHLMASQDWAQAFFARYPEAGAVEKRITLTVLVKNRVPIGVSIKELHVLNEKIREDIEAIPELIQLRKTLQAP